MKVSIVGHFNDELDEGVRNIGRKISQELGEEKDLEIKMLDVSSIYSFKELIRFKPDIIHFIISPTLTGLILSKCYSILSCKSNILISAIHPSIPKFKLLKLLKPDIVLVQSKVSEEIFKSIGFDVESLLNGVDITKFKPVDQEFKRQLRIKFGIPQDKFVVLHLASIKKRRNLNIFKEIQKINSNQVLIIGRDNEKFDKDIVEDLRSTGCIIWIKHFPNIEEIYNLSDCYIFPTIDGKGCIETPLSVLEAMSCNMPVITTRFGSLVDIFRDNDGIFFVNEEKDFLSIIDMIKNNHMEMRSRENVVKYSWEIVIRDLIKIYSRLMENKDVDRWKIK